MSIEFKCQECNALLTASDDHQGRFATCPTCGSATKIRFKGMEYCIANAEAFFKRADAAYFKNLTTWFVISVVAIFLCCGLGGIPATIIFYVCLYRCWQIALYTCVRKKIAPEPPEMTPGKAVGFLFIPFFNDFYWKKQAFQGLEDTVALLTGRQGSCGKWLFRLNFISAILNIVIGFTDVGYKVSYAVQGIDSPAELAAHGIMFIGFVGIYWILALVVGILTLVFFFKMKNAALLMLEEKENL